jgi:F-type H+-transporting ATPase subunit b
MQRSFQLALAIGAIFVAATLYLAGPVLAAQEEGHAPAAKKGHEPEKAAENGHPAEESANPLKAEPTLAIWTLAVFVLLMTVLGKFAWKPLIHALHEREKHLEHVLHETERARNESESLLSEHRKQMAHAADEVRRLLEEARADAQRTAENVIKQAQNEAESAKQRAQRDIGAARDSALAEIWHKTADMAVSVAGRVLSKELTETDHRRLLDAAISELPAAPGANGHGGKA